MAEPKTGDVIKFSEFAWSLHDGNVLNEPFYGVVESYAGEDTGGIIHVLTPRPCLRKFIRDSGLKWTFHRNYDKWRKIPSSRWPEEVCVAMAKHALLGELTKEDEE